MKDIEKRFRQKLYGLKEIMIQIIVKLIKKKKYLWLHKDYRLF